MQFEAIVEQATESIVITDLKGKIVYINPFFEKVTGYTKAEAIGKNPRILKSDKQSKAYYKALWDTITRGRTWHGEFVNKKKDGTLYFESATIFPIKDERGEITHFSAVKRDITKQKKTEAEQQRLVAVIEQMQESVMITDTQGHILYVNPFFESNTGYLLAEVKGKNPRILKSGKTAIGQYEQLWFSLKAGKPWKGDLVNRRKDGTLVYLKSIIAPIRDEFGEVKYYVDVKRDMTQEKLAQDKLEKQIEMLRKFKDATVDLALEMKKLEEKNRKLKRKTD